MSNGTLSETMGAMALVDQLRHRERELQEHLDLPHRRTEVAEQIRTYYQNNGIRYDDALIEQGVRAFFSRRLTFEAPALSMKDRLLVNLHMARRILFTLAGAAVMIFGLNKCMGGIIDSGRNIEAGKQADAMMTAQATLQIELTEQRQRVAAARMRLQEQPDPAVAELIAQAERTLAGQDVSFVIAPPELVTADNREPLQAQVNRAQQQVGGTRQALVSSQIALDTIDGVYQRRERLTALRQTPDFLFARQYIDALDEQLLDADRQLALVRAPADLEAIDRLLDAQTQAVESSRDQLSGIERHQKLLQRLQAQALPAADRQRLMRFANQASEAIAQRHWSAVDAPLDQLQRYLDFSSRALTLDLVDRPGVKSGVERCYEAAGCSQNSDLGKSWYLIVEARDAMGDPVPVPVSSIEDGEQRWSMSFGVRVSRAEYLKVRQDKLDDGHINERRVGDKPANSLRLRFTQRTTRNPDMITNW